MECTVTPRVFSIGGISGAGKDKVSQTIQGRFANVVRFPRTTTRQAEAWETDGVDYFFVTPEVFANQEANRELAGIERHNGDAYAINHVALAQFLQEHPDCKVLLVGGLCGVDLKSVMEMEVVNIFITATDKEAARRMQLRGDRPEKIKKRLAWMPEQRAAEALFDVTVQNADGCLEETVIRICEIMGIPVRELVQ